MDCTMCHKTLEIENKKEATYHDACMDKCNARISADECAYCGEPRDGSIVSAEHCKDRKFVGY